jgi:hypothetical protein
MTPDAFYQGSTTKFIRKNNRKRIYN